MTQNINTFAPNYEKGQLVNDAMASTVPCQIDPASTSTIAAGTAVKIIDKAGASLPVVEKAAATDEVFGFVRYNAKANNYKAGGIVDVASFGQEMYMEASAAVNGGALVEIVAADDTVITSSGTNKIVGINLLKVASGELARVLIQAPKVNQV